MDVIDPPEASTHQLRASGRSAANAEPDGALAAAALLSELLGGVVDLRVTRSVWQVTGGDEAAIREVILDAKETGCLVQGADAWTLIAPLPLRRLTRLSSERLGQLSDEAWECAELLALGAPLPIAVAVKLLDPMRVRELERVGVACFLRDEDGARLAFSDAVHRQALLGGLSPARRQYLLGRLDRAYSRSACPRAGHDSATQQPSASALIEVFDTDPSLPPADASVGPGLASGAATDAELVRQVAAAFAGAQRLDRAGVKHAVAAVSELRPQHSAPCLASDLAYGVELLMADGRTPQERLLDVRRALQRSLEGAATRIGWWSAVAGRLQFAAGDLEAARDHLIQADLVIEDRDPLHLRPRVLIDRALVSACAGVPAEAQRLLGRVADERDRSVSIAARAELVESVVAAQYEGARVAAELALDSGDRSVAAGRLKEGLEAWHLAVRCGHAAEVAARLGSLPAHGPWAGHPEAMLLRRHAATLAADDGPGLAVVAKDFAAAGRYLLAAEVAAQAAALVDDADTCALAAGLAGRVPAARTPGLDGATRTTLTPRRRQVATLAAAGCDGRQIADRLGLSARTADNHLAHVYGQLGLSGRRELERLYRPALTSARIETVAA